MADDQDVGKPSSIASDIARSAPLSTWAAPTSAVMLLRALAQHNLATYRQSLRIATRAWKLGHALGFQASDSQRLWLIGLLHDVGMIHVPRSFLRQVGVRREQDERLMWMHPLHGAALVMEDAALATLAPAIAAHHERSDGTGYPRRLRMPQIPEEAVFIAVVDALDIVAARQADKRLIIRPDKHGASRAGTAVDWEARLIEAAVELLAEEARGPIA